MDADRICIRDLERRLPIIGRPYVASVDCGLAAVLH